MIKIHPSIIILWFWTGCRWDAVCNHCMTVDDNWNYSEQYLSCETFRVYVHMLYVPGSATSTQSEQSKLPISQVFYLGRCMHKHWNCGQNLHVLSELKRAVYFAGFDRNKRQVKVPLSEHPMFNVLIGFFLQCPISPISLEKLISKGSWVSRWICDCVNDRMLSSRGVDTLWSQSREFNRAKRKNGKSILGRRASSRGVEASLVMINGISFVWQKHR